jgi:periplasmic divalent cation tolerance protein
MNKVFLYVTAESAEEAARIGGALVEERLAACANVLPAMTSIYRWQGAVQRAAEAVLILKTREDLASEATARIKALHTYECPCVVVLPLAGGNPDFLAWIEQETK